MITTKSTQDESTIQEHLDKLKIIRKKKAYDSSNASIFDLRKASDCSQREGIVLLSAP